MPSWKLKRSLTKGEFVKICLDLSELFSNEFQADYKFRPLSRCEGGIECHVWPGKCDGQYKQVRLDFGHWPWVPQDWRQAWASEAERDNVAVMHATYVWTDRDLPHCSERYRAKYVRMMNTRERHNRLWFKATDTKWKGAEQALMKMYLKDAGVI